MKPRLRRETFENSFMLSRVGGRQFLLVLLIIAQVMIQIEMLMMQYKMLMLMFMPALMLSVQTIVILLMLGLLFFLGGAPPASPRPLPVAEPGLDWLRLIQFFLLLDHHRAPWSSSHSLIIITLLGQVVAEPAGCVHHPPPHLASCQLCRQTLPWRQEVRFCSRSPPPCWCC